MQLSREDTQTVKRNCRSNLSALLCTAALLAEVRGATLEQVAADTRSNTRRLFRLDGVDRDRVR